MKPLLEKQLTKKEQKEIIKNTGEYVEKHCGNCQWNHFCCALRVKLSFWDRMRIRLSGHRIRKIADHHYKHGWMIKNEKGYCIFLNKGETRWVSGYSSMDVASKGVLNPLRNKTQCKIYKSRPRDCRIFPHFYEKDMNCGDLVQKYSYKEIDGTEFVEIKMS